MKKPLLIILLLVLYLGLSSGITINLHFCRGEISEISFWHKAGCHTCHSHKENEEKSRCPFCHEEDIYLDSVEDAIIFTELNENKINFKPLTILLFLSVTETITQWIFDGIELFNFELILPPLWQNSPSLFILHCLYLI